MGSPPQLGISNWLNAKLEILVHENYIFVLHVLIHNFIINNYFIIKMLELRFHIYIYEIIPDMDTKVIWNIFGFGEWDCQKGACSVIPVFKYSPIIPYYKFVYLLSEKGVNCLNNSSKLTLNFQQ